MKHISTSRILSILCILFVYTWLQGLPAQLLHIGEVQSFDYEFDQNCIHATDLDGNTWVLEFVVDEHLVDIKKYNSMRYQVLNTEVNTDDYGT